VIASEEEATPVAVEETDSGNYIVVFDPLDGSSNIDAGKRLLRLGCKPCDRECCWGGAVTGIRRPSSRRCR
jgi:fructose-1,6-bisphosphatase I